MFSFFLWFEFLQIYSLPTFELIFRTDDLANGTPLLKNSLFFQFQQSTSSFHNDVNLSIVEIALHPIGNAPLPFLFVILENDDLLVYRCFHPAPQILGQPHGSAPLPVAFQKWEHSLIIRPTPDTPTPNAAPVKEELNSAKRKTSQDITDEKDGKTKRLKKEPGEETENQIEEETEKKEGKETDEDEEEGKNMWYRRIHHFSNIGQINGVFISGKFPAWVLGQRGYPRIFPMRMDSYVLCFADFHNVNCHRGFAYFNQAGVMKICQLFPNMHWDLPWPVRKVPLWGTPRHIAYHRYRTLQRLTDMPILFCCFAF